MPEKNGLSPWNTNPSFEQSTDPTSDPPKGVELAKWAPGLEDFVGPGARKLFLPQRFREMASKMAGAHLWGVWFELIEVPAAL